MLRSQGSRQLRVNAAVDTKRVQSAVLFPREYACVRACALDSFQGFFRGGAARRGLCAEQPSRLGADGSSRPCFRKAACHVTLARRKKRRKIKVASAKTRIAAAAICPEANSTRSLCSSALLTKFRTRPILGTEWSIDNLSVCSVFLPGLSCSRPKNRWLPGLPSGLPSH